MQLLHQVFHLHSSYNLTEQYIPVKYNMTAYLRNTLAFSLEIFSFSSQWQHPAKKLPSGKKCTQPPSLTLSMIKSILGWYTPSPVNIKRLKYQKVMNILEVGCPVLTRLASVAKTTLWTLETTTDIIIHVFFKLWLCNPINSLSSLFAKEQPYLEKHNKLW